MSFEKKIELPAVAFRKILPYLATEDMKNVGLAVKASPTLYNEFSFYTKVDSRDVYPEAKLICPYCLIAGGYISPWQKLTNAMFGNDIRLRHGASASLQIFKSGPSFILECKNLDQIIAPIKKKDRALRLNPSDPANRFRVYMDKRSNDGVKNGKTVEFALRALKDLDMFESARDLVSHIEDSHHPTGKNWRKLPPWRKQHAKQLKNEFIRAVEIDELGSLLDNKKYRGQLYHQSPRKNILLRRAICEGIVSNKRPFSRRQFFMNFPLSLSDTDQGQNYHRTLGLAYLLEDNLKYSNKQFQVIDPKIHKLWAVRNHLACMTEVFQSCEFQTIQQHDVNRFGMYNAIKVIFDHVINLPY